MKDCAYKVGRFAVGRILVSILVLAALQAIVRALPPTSSATQDETSREQPPMKANELWGMDKGTVVTTYSPLTSGFDIRDIFGAHFGTIAWEPGATTFADGNAEGFVDWVEWTTAKPVVVGRVLLKYADDYPGNMWRTLKEFRLFGKVGGTWKELAQRHLPIGIGVATTEFAISPDHAYQAFRAEFTRGYASNGNSAPRIWGLRAYPPTLDQLHSVTTLSKAAARGDAPFVDIFLKQGEDVSATQDPEDSPPIVAAGQSGSIDCLNLLLAKKARIDQANSRRRTALMEAASRGFAEFVTAALIAGADPGLTDADGMTAEDLARKGGFTDIATKLERANPVKAGAAELRKALASRDAVSVKTILDDRKDLVSHRFPKDWTPLHFAAFYGDGESAKLLIAYGADLEARTSSQSTPLMIACQEGKFPVVQSLLGKGASVKAADADGWTPLHFAAQQGDVEIVKLLLKNQADRRVKDKSGKTPLQIAKSRKNTAVVKVLQSG